MIDFDYIIFHGDRNTGRSSLLFTLANICKSNNENTFFFGATDEFNSESLIESPFSRKFFYRHRDTRLIENIFQIAEREKCQYVFIDDIDFLSVEDLKIINESKIKKIATCLTGKIPKITTYKSYELSSVYDDATFREEKYLSSDGSIIPISVFFKTFERDKKINSILK